MARRVIRALDSSSSDVSLLVDCCHANKTVVAGHQGSDDHPLSKPVKIRNLEIASVSPSNKSKLKAKHFLHDVWFSISKEPTTGIGSLVYIMFLVIWQHAS